LWSFEEPPSENAVRAQIKSLRQKLKKAGAAADLIETVYGLGYRLKSRESATTHQQQIPLEMTALGSGSSRGTAIGLQSWSKQRRLYEQALLVMHYGNRQLVRLTHW
jgi:hypothetical protein